MWGPTVPQPGAHSPIGFRCQISQPRLLWMSGQQPCCWILMSESSSNMQQQAAASSNILRGPLSPWSACFPPALRFCGPKWDDFGPNQPGLKRAWKGPNSPKMVPGGSSWVPPGSGVPIHGQNPLGQRMSRLFAVFLFLSCCPFFGCKWCRLAQFGPVWILFASCGPKPKLTIPRAR